MLGVVEPRHGRGDLVLDARRNGPDVAWLADVRHRLVRVRAGTGVSRRGYRGRRRCALGSEAARGPRQFVGARRRVRVTACPQAAEQRTASVDPGATALEGGRCPLAHPAAVEGPGGAELADRASGGAADVDLGSLAAQERPSADVAGGDGDRGADRLCAHGVERTTPSRHPARRGHRRRPCWPGDRGLPRSAQTPSRIHPDRR